MRPNRKEPESALFWFQSLYHCCDLHYGFRHVGRMAASYIREQGSLLHYAKGSHTKMGISRLVRVRYSSKGA